MINTKSKFYRHEDDAVLAVPVDAEVFRWLSHNLTRPISPYMVGDLVLRHPYVHVLSGGKLRTIRELQTGLKLNADDALAIKSLMAQGLRSRAIATQLCLPFRAVDNVVLGNTWQDVQPYECDVTLAPQDSVEVYVRHATLGQVLPKPWDEVCQRLLQTHPLFALFQRQMAENLTKS